MTLLLTGITRVNSAGAVGPTVSIEFNHSHQHSHELHSHHEQDQHDDDGSEPHSDGEPSHSHGIFSSGQVLTWTNSSFTASIGTQEADLVFSQFRDRFPVAPLLTGIFRPPMTA